MIELKPTHIEVTAQGKPVCFLYPDECPTAYEVRPATGFVRVKSHGQHFKEILLSDHPGMTIQEIIDVFNAGNIQFCHHNTNTVPDPEINHNFVNSDDGTGATVAFNMVAPLSGWTPPLNDDGSPADDGDTVEVFFNNGVAKFKKINGVWTLQGFVMASPTHTVEDFMTENISIPTNAVPQNVPNPLPVPGSTIREEYFNGYVIYTYNGSTWDQVGRQFNSQPTITP